jgi:hypothetical protein
MYVPNLFLRERPMMAERLYARLWMELRQRRRWGEIVQMCRRVRGHWMRSRRGESPRYLIGWEIDALIAIGLPEQAFRQYRRWLAAPSRRERLRTLEQRLKRDPMGILFQETSVLYASGRFEEGGRTFEAWLRMALDSIGRRKAGWTAYGLLHHLENGLPEPNEGGPTLAHFYRKLDRHLDAWADWPRWVEALEPGLFRVAGISRRALREDPTRLAQFVSALETQRRRRTRGSSVTFGQRDLLEKASAVRRRHERVQARREAHARRMERRREQLHAKWARYFGALKL